MRWLMSLAAMLALADAAVADEPRYAPAVGTVITERVLTTAAATGRTTGMIYRVTTTEGDGTYGVLPGTFSVGRITPLANLIRCPAADTSKDCRQARNFPGATSDGDMVTIPIPPAIAAEAAKTALTVNRYLFEGMLAMVFLDAKDLDEIEHPEIGAEPLYVFSTARQCDLEALASFFPLGRMPSATVRCRVEIGRERNRVPGAKDTLAQHDALHQLTFAGRSRKATPAGEREVALITYTVAGSEGSPPAEGSIEIIEDLGIASRHLVNTGPPDHPLGTGLREVLKIGP